MGTENFDDQLCLISSYGLYKGLFCLSHEIQRLLPAHYFFSSSLHHLIIFFSLIEERTGVADAGRAVLACELTWAAEERRRRVRVT